MIISENIRQVYSEVDEFINLLDKETREKIPEKLRVMFKEEKDHEYVKHIDRTIAIKNQNLKEDTIAIIALLNLKYICDDEHEKERLIQIYKENDKKYEKILQVSFDEEDVFSKHNSTNYENRDLFNDKKALTIKKDSIMKKIIRKFRNIFIK